MVLDPPHVWVAFVWYAVALLGFMVIIRRPGIRSVVNMAGGIAFIIGGVGGWTTSHASTLTIDKGAGVFAKRALVVMSKSNGKNKSFPRSKNKTTRLSAASTASRISHTLRVP